MCVCVCFFFFFFYCLVAGKVLDNFLLMLEKEKTTFYMLGVASLVSDDI